MSDDSIHPRIVDQTTKNLGLARRFLAEAFENDAIVDEIPSGTKLVLIPLEDPELAQMNFELAVRQMMQGERVAMRLVGGLTPEAEAWKAADVRNIFVHEIKFPDKELHAGDVSIVWDQDRDTLLVNYFSDRELEVKWLDVGPHVKLQVDAHNYEIVGYLVSSFFQMEALHSSALLRAFRKAEIRPITDEELGNNDVAIVRRGETAFDNDEAAAVATAFLTILGPRRRSEDEERARETA